jgi:hypothetical protein
VNATFSIPQGASFPDLFSVTLLFLNPCSLVDRTATSILIFAADPDVMAEPTPSSNITGSSFSSPKDRIYLPPFEPFQHTPPR